MRAALFAILCASFIVALLSAAAAAQEARPLSRPFEPTGDRVDARFGGSVTEITKTSISILWPGDKKPKVFALSETLMAGRFSPKSRVIISPEGRIFGGWTVSAHYLYRLNEVKVGDLVAIRYSHLGTDDICDQIGIYKRPGGLVPPLSEEAEKLRNPLEIVKSRIPPGTKVPQGFLAPENWPYIPYHEEMNARWDLEDRGIPYPAKFGDKRRFPLAPMPREKGALPAKIMQ